ncbi:MAG: hypothetical protein AB7K36_15525 [Chloroflexota bacterium]
MKGVHLRGSAMVRLLALAFAGVLAVQGLLVQATPAAAQGINPRDVALTDDDAGKEAARSADEEGTDDRSAWIHLRWQRQEDGPDFLTGPGTVDNKVWVAKDLASAKAIYQEEANKNSQFPEAFHAANGPYALEMAGIGDESSALSACDDCNAKDDIYLHHRLVFRRGVVVEVIYIYGNQDTAPQNLMSWFGMQAFGRIPDSASQAPERAGGDPAPAAQTGAPAPTTTEAAPVNNPAPAANNPAPPANADLNQANPKDLAVKIDEAGKRAEIAEQKDGTDANGKWYSVRYERPGTGGRFHEGPVTVYSYVYVGKDIESAQKVFADDAKLNEKMPEATEKVGDKFELKEANEVGQEGQGLSACQKSCNSGGEIYVHKRLVSRQENIVSVIYLYGLSAEDGLTDWHARYFGNQVMQRARGE